MSFLQYAKRKDSGVEWLGIVPNHWNIRRLGFYFRERREKVSDKDFPPLSVTKSGVVPQLETAAKTDDGDNRKKVVAGDFVINSRSDRKGSAGLAEQDGSVSLINTVLTPLEGINPRFVHYLLRSVAFQEEFYRYGKGIVADLWSTNYSEMKVIALAVPPTQEQAVIASLLDYETTKIDGLVEEQKRLIELLREKRQTVVTQVVTKGLIPNMPTKDSGVEWLGEMPARWEVLPLRRVISKIEQGWSPIAENRVAEIGEPAIMKLSAISGGKFFAAENKAFDPASEPDPRYAIRAGDFLLTRANTPSLVGECCVVEGGVQEGLMLPDLVYRITTKDRISKDYLRYWLRSQVGRFVIKIDARGSSMTMAKISQEHIRNWPTFVPDLDEQRGIVKYLDREIDRLDALIVEVEAAISLLQERRDALISAAVTGKIDVRGLGEGDARILDVAAA
ncbi:hypothetical protein [Bradyrhizobium brasilense]|uniref:restriction endonuclease subunit S n=1 Tax=Bradyrhizobium brasilense TaxID=1419277 RepID=UPI001E4C6FA8|nr:hypothetical protein [Bradyrhizobium brasilense]MCC8972688.1 type I restriction endonuclease subunit S [Bradyrhizobium brasilense]